MKYVGAHVSAAGGVENAPLNAKKIGARAFALFLKNQKQWRAPPLTAESIAAFEANCRECGYKREHILPHSGYLINLGNPDSDLRKKSLAAFCDELERCEQLGLKLFNFHPGSNVKKLPEEECLELIAEGINEGISRTSGVTAVIENTAGQGSSMGHRFEQLAALIERVEDKGRVGVCLDTCHSFVAGYDLKSEKGYQSVFREFDRVIGMKYLKGMHLNDSKGELGSKLDRHHSLGEGELGLDLFRRLMNDRRLNNIPLILETIDEDLWPQEIELLYSFTGKKKTGKHTGKKSQ